MTQNNAPAIILVSPQMGENIGAAARVMLNFGCHDLRLVTPRDGWPNPKAIEMGRGADVVINNVRLFNSTLDAVADLTDIYATTTRMREMEKPVLTARQFGERLEKKQAEGAKIGIVFGRESSGLDNDDLAWARAIVTIPLNPEHTSLNLAQAVAILCYEWFSRQKGLTLHTEGWQEDARLATQAEMAGLFEHLEGELDVSGFFKTPEKRPRVVANLRSFFQRTQPTQQDINTLRGIIRALVKKQV